MPARWNTLFVRLMVAQAVTAIGMTLVFGGVFYVERNRALARLVAERWAPALAQAAGLPAVPLHAEPPPLLRAPALPEGAIVARERTPRVAALVQGLQAHGVPVDEVAFSRGLGAFEGQAVTWLRVLPPAGAPLWLGITDTLLEPRLPQRVLLALALAVAVVAAASWWVARRLARPLEQLRQRMQAHRPQAVLADAPAPAPTPALAEVAAIDQAWCELKQRLARHERERALLLAGISHDLRSPLARIRMAAELLPAGPEVAARREAIVRNVGVADRLIESFLDHVRAGELPLDEAVDVAALARAVAAAAGRGRDELVCEAPGALVLPQANRLLVERVLQNLLDNALRHGRAPVRLRVAAAPGGGVHVEVHDAGAGIAPAERERLLQAFARGDAARGTPGTGLGLAVVQRVVARLGGTLAFSHEGGVHRVRVALPSRA